MQQRRVIPTSPYKALDNLHDLADIFADVRGRVTISTRHTVALGDRVLLDEQADYERRGKGTNEPISRALAGAQLRDNGIDTPYTITTSEFKLHEQTGELLGHTRVGYIRLRG